MTVFPPAPSPSLTIERVHPQLDQFITSVVRVTGCEPTAEQITAFMARNGLIDMTLPVLPFGERQGLARCNGEARTFARQT